MHRDDPLPVRLHPECVEEPRVVPRHGDDHVDVAPLGEVDRDVLVALLHLDRSFVRKPSTSDLWIENREKEEAHSQSNESEWECDGKLVTIKHDT